MIIHSQLMPLLGMISNLSDGSDGGFVDDGFFLYFYAAVILLLRLFLFALSLAIFLGLIYVVHLLFSLPMRRTERARLFLNLLEDALQRGQSIEDLFLSIVQSKDRTVGVRFHMIAAYIESGLGFGEALDKVPGFLPPQIIAMLHAGETGGDIKKVLPACHEILRDRPAGVRSAVHYMLLMVLFYSPGAIFLIMAMLNFVVPKFKEVASGMDVEVWPLAQFVFENAFVLVGVETFICASLIIALLIYVGGPRFVRWFQFRGLPLVDWITWHVPWKRKRLQRTFSAMLAVLLDSGIPEAVAVRLAGDSTANEICRCRSKRVIAAMGQGTKLDDAVRAFDDSGEFHWRLSNATNVRGGFLNALSGWHEALDAKAFQQEEATAHIVTTGLVVLNGMVVALIAISMFGLLVMILRGMVAL